MEMNVSRNNVIVEKLCQRVVYISVIPPHSWSNRGSLSSCWVCMAQNCQCSNPHSPINYSRLINLIYLSEFQVSPSSLFLKNKYLVKCNIFYIKAKIFGLFGEILYYLDESFCLAFLYRYNNILPISLWIYRDIFSKSFPVWLSFKRRQFDNY